MEESSRPLPNLAQNCFSLTNAALWQNMSDRNLTTSLRRKSRGDPMHAFDALPVELRRWLASAVLPWSARSVARLWQRALRDGKGDREEAFARIEAAQQRLLQRDVAKVWGKDYPL
jgi:hypothetical protein